MDTDLNVEIDGPIFSHLVAREEGQSLGKTILDAVMNKTSLTGLCGRTWFPTRESEEHETCPECIEVYGFTTEVVV